MKKNLRKKDYSKLELLPVPMIGGGLVKLVGMAVGVGVLGVGGYLAYNWYVKGQQDSAQGALDSEVSAQQANNLLKLIHPVSYAKSGFLTLVTNPLQIVDSARDYVSIVDKKEIIKVAVGINNFDKVNEFYSKLTKDSVNLADDLRKVLSETEQKNFFNIITGNKLSTETLIKNGEDVYANPSALYKGLVSVYYDKTLKTPAFSYTKGMKLGKIIEVDKIPVLGKDGLVYATTLYKLLGGIGQILGKNVYVLSSQVSKKAL